MRTRQAGHRGRGSGPTVVKTVEPAAGSERHTAVIKRALVAVCLAGLSGCSGSSGVPAAGDGVTPTGAAEAPTTQGSLDEPEPVRLPFDSDTAPATFRDRQKLPSCGTAVLGHGEQPRLRPG